jgi:hypothetical protein
LVRKGDDCLTIDYVVYFPANITRREARTRNLAASARSNNNVENSRAQSRFDESAFAEIGECTASQVRITRKANLVERVGDVVACSANVTVRIGIYNLGTLALFNGGVEKGVAICRIDESVKTSLFKGSACYNRLAGECNIAVAILDDVAVTTD